MPDTISAEVPHVQQTLRLPKSVLESFQEWAIDGSGRAVAARVTDSAGRTALIQNRWTDGWFLPGGAVERDETLVGAARREVREETGLEATIDTPLVVLDQSYLSERTGEEWYSALYVVYAATADGEIPDASELGVTDDEIVAAQWFDDLPEDLHDGDLLLPYL